MFERIAEEEGKRRAFAIVTITKTKGIVPRKDGRLVVYSDGSVEGTVGGGLVERSAIQKAKEALITGKGGVVHEHTPSGEVELFIDLPVSGRILFVIGAGHVGIAIAELMHAAGYEIRILDIHPVSFDKASQIIIKENWHDVLEGISFPSNSAVIISVHDKAEIMPFLDKTDSFYIGCLSSRSKAVFGKAGHFIPMGLDIGANTPEEISISVAAEIIKTASKRNGRSLRDNLHSTILVRGAGDLATGVIIKLHNAGYNVVCTDIEKPTQIRRTVSFAEAMYEGSCEVEGVKCMRVDNTNDCFALFDERIVPLLCDPELECLTALKPLVIIDAILAKKNLGTRKEMAPLVIGLGPGFTASEDVDIVIETMRGHELGRIIRKGTAKENTGIPGLIAGYGKERVVRSENEGVFHPVKTFGDVVSKGDIIAYVDETPVPATIDGLIRGMLHEGLYVTSGFKVADIDPRGEGVDFHHVSDKARCIAGAVLEAVDAFVKAC